MARNRPGHFILLAVFAGTAAACVAAAGLAVTRLWPLPLLFVCFTLAYAFDVRIPGLGRMNADHLVAFPGLLLVENPVAVGLLASGGFLASRLIRGRKTLTGGAGLGLDLFQAGLSVTAGAAVLRASGAFADGAGSAGDLPWLVVAAWVQFGIGLLLVTLDSRLGGESLWTPAFRAFAGKAFLWYTASLPYLALVMLEVAQGEWYPFFLSLVPLVGIGWVLRLIAEMERKAQALIEASRRQEFLLQVLSSEAGSLENDSFLKNLLEGLHDFVPWDHELVFLVETPFLPEPVLYSRKGMPQDPYGAKSHLEAMLELGSLQRAKVSGPGSFTPLLSSASRHQLLVPMATGEVAFGALVVERETDPAFAESEVRFVNLAMAQVARFIQDEILKRQILHTNRRLVHQTHYLSEILEVSNLLKISMEPHTILEKVAQCIREGIGFQSVLISLYREEAACFERVAQAGEDERWEEIRGVSPPASEILELLQERYRTGNCYLLRHNEGGRTPGPYDVLPTSSKPSHEADDWHPLDYLFVPMLNKDNRLIGVISVDEPSDGKVPSMEALNALEIIANQAVQALESSQTHASVRHQAVVDGLTNLYNHRHFQESLARTAREHAGGVRPYALLMLDLDNFKAINDRFGHVAGDAVLKGVGEAVLSVTRKEDVAARYGGEEFALILPGLDAPRAAAVGDRIRRLVEARAFGLDGLDASLRVTLSVGVSAYPAQGEDHHRLLEAADAALYRAKKAGKNRVCGGE